MDNGQKTYDEQYLGFGPLGKPIIESLPMGVVTFDSGLKIVEANRQAARLIELGNAIDKSLAKGSDGAATSRPDWTGQLKSVLSRGKMRSFDRVTYTLDGQTKLLRIVCTPLKKAKTKRIIGGTVIIEDVTENVNIQRQLANVEKLAVVGKLASKVAHELNNPMDGILRYINLTLRIIEQENLEKPKEYLAQCRQGLMRMVQIVSELLEFSRSTYAPSEYVKLEQIIEDAIKMMDSRAVASNARILRDYSPDIPQVTSGNLFQVFCNLIKNAVEAMPDGGELNISTCLTGGDTVVVEFRDTGIGFAPENTEAIFEPFFTTKDKGEGTGLGLAVCRDIVERYRGRIIAENAPGGGSTFTVYLPVASKET
ncbi:MAG: two-component system sensor histidine kinase NtrB [Planctomycetota bacterium]|jgi:signal transduction histidine kinase